MHKNIAAEFETGLSKLIGQVCWGIVAGKGTGSVISLDVGGKVLRESPLRNPHLSHEQQKYESQLGLYVECTWRVESQTQVICGAWDDNIEGGAMLDGLQRLVDQTIDDVTLTKPAFDLVLNFSNGLVLRIFCDATNTTEMADNYSLFLPEAIYIVGNRSALKREARNQPYNSPHLAR